MKIQLVMQQSKRYMNKKVLNSPKVVFDLLKEIQDLDREIFFVLTLNANNQLINIHIVSIGILNSALVHSREVFRPAIIDNAYSIILVHNHPSGNPEPSEEDTKITKELKNAGEIIGIKILDHIIIGNNDYVSLKDEW
jgi:DNA repair protein RadC